MKNARNDLRQAEVFLDHTALPFEIKRGKVTVCEYGINPLPVGSHGWCRQAGLGHVTFGGSPVFFKSLDTSVFHNILPLLMSREYTSLTFSEAPERKTRSPIWTGELQPGKGISVFQRMFFPEAPFPAYRIFRW